MSQNIIGETALRKRGFLVCGPLLLIMVFTAIALTALLVPIKAGSGTLPDKLLGSGNDIIAVRPDARPSTENILMRDLVLRGRDSQGMGKETPGLTTLCLQNMTTSSEAAFDNARSTSPRYGTVPGAAICGRFEPTRHEFFFYRSSSEGKLSLVLSGKLDLTDYKGRLITLQWQ